MAIQRTALALFLASLCAFLIVGGGPRGGLVSVSHKKLFARQATSPACQAPAALGAVCIASNCAACLSGCCIAGACADASVCFGANATACPAATPTAALGSPCSGSSCSFCASGCCIGGVCASSEQCWGVADVCSTCNAGTVAVNTTAPTAPPTDPGQGTTAPTNNTAPTTPAANTTNTTPGTDNGGATNGTTPAAPPAANATTTTQPPTVPTTTTVVQQVTPNPGALAVDPRSPAGQGLALLNSIRAGLGQAPVDLGADITKGADNHANYLLLNFGRPEIAGLLAHTENPALPGFTPEGAAPSAETIAWGTPSSAVQAWLDTLYHRLPLINPGLRRVGLGFRSDANSSPVVMRYEAPVATDPNAEPVLYPKNGQIEVPLSFGGELPNPLPDGWPTPVGYPLSMSVSGTAKLSGGWATLNDTVLGGFVECWVWTAEKPANPGVSMDQAIAIIPRKVLRVGTTYIASYFAQLNGAPIRTWTSTFTTVAPVEVDANSVASLDAANGKVVRITGKVAWAPANSANDAWFMLSSPHSKQVNVMIGADWNAYNMSTKLGVADPSGLIGKTVRALANEVFIGNFININLLQGELVIVG